MPILAEDSVTVQVVALTVPPLLFWLWVVWLEALGVFDAPPVPVTTTQALPARPTAQIIPFPTQRVGRR